MNKTKIFELLEQWKDLINIGEQKSRVKATKSKDGLLGRIKRTTGQPVIFDFDIYNDQKEIQNKLCKELPHLTNLIRSQPEIMDGYPWIRGDFIELYYEHYRIIIKKIRQFILKKTNI
jgi:hypothetical protein